MHVEDSLYAESKNVVTLAIGRIHSAIHVTICFVEHGARAIIAILYVPMANGDKVVLQSRGTLAVTLVQSCVAFLTKLKNMLKKRPGVLEHSKTSAAVVTVLTSKMSAMNAPQKSRAVV